MIVHAARHAIARMGDLSLAQVEYQLLAISH